MSGSPRASPQQEVTNLLVEWKQGNKAAMDFYAARLQRTSTSGRALPSERAIRGNLQPTALVHEAYLRLVAQNMPDWESRAHFFGVAAHLMRQILVDHARKHRSAKRGGGAEKILSMRSSAWARKTRRHHRADDDALKALAEIDERKAKVIELRFFGGLSVEETAVALGSRPLRSGGNSDWRRLGSTANSVTKDDEAERWKAVEELFHRALEVPEANERARSSKRTRRRSEIVARSAVADRERYGGITGSAAAAVKKALVNFHEAETAATAPGRDVGHYRLIARSGAVEWAPSIWPRATTDTTRRRSRSSWSAAAWIRTSSSPRFRRSARSWHPGTPEHRAACWMAAPPTTACLIW